MTEIGYLGIGEARWPIQRVEVEEDGWTAYHTGPFDNQVDVRGKVILSSATGKPVLEGTETIHIPVERNSHLTYRLRPSNLVLGASLSEIPDDPELAEFLRRWKSE